MKNVLLVAVGHEIKDGLSDRLMSSACTERFKIEIEPFINDRSLVLCEGVNHNQLVTPAHPKYNFLNQRLLGLPESKRPTLGGFDHRQSESVFTVDAHAQRLDLWDKTAMELIVTDMQRKPRSLAEVLHILRNEQHVARLARQPTPEERASARWARIQARKFDRDYLTGLRKHGRRFDSCFFVGGCTHGIAMALESGYRLADLIPEPEVPDVYYAYLATYVWPRLVYSGP